MHQHMQREREKKGARTTRNFASSAIDLQPLLAKIVLQDSLDNLSNALRHHPSDWQGAREIREGNSLLAPGHANQLVHRCN